MNILQRCILRFLIEAMSSMNTCFLIYWYFIFNKSYCD